MTAPEVAKVSVGLTATPIKAAIKKALVKKTVPSKPKAHPPTSEMVNAALSALKDKKGSSLQAIKKYIVTTYKVDLKRQSAFIRKYLKSAVEKETIVQAKGNGASGRFKLATEMRTVKKPKSEKSTVEKAVVKSTANKKNAAAKKQVAASKTAAKSSSPKSRSKSTKSVKAPAAKTLKPKKVITPKATSVKK